MRFLRDDRAQAIQVGAVLIFGILIVFLALYQGFVVPNENEEIEFNHNQELQSEMTDMRSTVVSMPGRTTAQSSSVTLGVRYPSRAIFVNPGPASGTLRTVGTTDSAINLTIENATADGNVGDFWDGSEWNDTTGGIEYRPSYNLFATAPWTVYEHSVLFNDFGDESLAITGQALIRDDRITLVTLNGSFSESRVGKASVDFQPVSTDTRTVEVENESGPVTISVPTRLNEEEWTDLLDDEERVESVSTEEIPGTEYAMLEVELEDDEKYKLQLAKVGVGTGIDGTDAAYMTDIDGDGTTVDESQSQELTVEVRDEYNNPVRDVRVFNSSVERGNITGGTKTGDDGQITVTYTADDDAGDFEETINFSFAGEVDNGAFDSASPENVTMTVTVEALPEVEAGDGLSAFNTTWDREYLENKADNEEYLQKEGGVWVFNQTEADGDDLELFMQTDSDPEDAKIEFAVNDTKIADIHPTENTTETDGTASTTLEPKESGTITVFTWSGGSGDKLEVELEDVTDEITEGDFSGVVEDDDGNPIGETDVTFEAEDETFTETVETNADGTYTVEGVEEGTYDITASADGFEDDTVENVEITAGEETEDVDFTLSELPEMAERIEYVEGSGEDADNDGRIEFDLENTGTEESVEITALTIDDTDDPQAEIVDNDENREFDGAGGFINLDPGQIVIGDTNPTDLNESAAIDPGATETFNLEQFREDDGDERNLNNNDVTITLIFSDGSELTFTAEDL